MKSLRINLTICMRNQAPDQEKKKTKQNYVWVFGAHHRQLQFTWQTSWGGAAFPTPDLVHSQYIVVSKENYSQGLMLP